MTRPGTLGELKASGWESRPVKEEVRSNALARIADGKPLVDGVLGYDDTVLPQLENALVAGHDVILLGERGQAKTRIIRGLVALLDEWMPIVGGSEVNDDPEHPISAHAKVLLAERGDETPIEWVPRDRRFGEKLATPDTSIADLIGEVDPIKVAEGRYLADELTIHYGLVPRTNRGIFAINELPDLAERIQVGLLNVLEERDVQIRGYKIRLSITNYETLVANASRRALRSGEREVVPRVSDLDALVASTAGKIEFETLDDGREEQVLERIVKASVLEVFRARSRPERLTRLVTAFDEGVTVHTGEAVASSAEIASAYRALAKALHPDARPTDPAAADRFKRVTAAYRVLADVGRRRDYDERRAHGLAPVMTAERPTATAAPGSPPSRRSARWAIAGGVACLV